MGLDSTISPFLILFGLIVLPLALLMMLALVMVAFVLKRLGLLRWRHHAMSGAIAGALSGVAYCLWMGWLAEELTQGVIAVLGTSALGVFIATTWWLILVKGIGANGLATT